MPQPEQALAALSPGIFVVIVLYKTTATDSTSYLTLLAALAVLSPAELRVQVMLYDNTPQGETPADQPAFVRYVASSSNTGLATAYNLAVDMAKAGGFDWLLTLDQDTELPVTFFQQLAPLASQHQANPCIAAIVPQIFSGTRILSPNWFVAGVKPRWFPRGFSGVPDKAVYALNSGALIRVSAVRQVGGYSRYFWLDASDIYLFRKFEQAGLAVFVAGTIALQHDLSITSIGTKMSLTRYQNALSAGSAFFDVEHGMWAGIGHTLLLLHVYLGQLRRHEDHSIRSSTLGVIRSRIFESRQTRLRSWLKALEGQMTREYRERKAAHRVEETTSILAVVVLYQTPPDKSAALNSLLEAVKQAASVYLRFHILLYDNTPDNHANGAIPPGVTYTASPRNAGLSEAYNEAVKLASTDGFDWILTLDQDTSLPPDFLQVIIPIAREVRDQERVAAILPLVMEDKRILSPHWFKHDFFPRAFTKESYGVQQESVYAFNSGALLRTCALQAIGGYNPLFWLDYSDAYLFRMLHRSGYKGFVAGTIILEHHLSLLHAQSMPDARYQNIVEAGSAFCDLYRGPLVGLEFTYRLVRSYLGQLRKPGDGRKKDILGSATHDRFFRSRKQRIQVWITKETNRRFPS